ncbi:MAG: hypothetical protein AABZ74_12320 [Cyanobacteriota bacterium]
MIIILIFIFFFLVLVPYGIYKITSILNTKWLEYILTFLYFPCFFVLLISYLSNSNNGGYKNAFVKSNMHTFQTILETYSVDASGFYPKNVEELHKFASTGNNKYWKNFENPYTRESGKGNSYDDMPITKKTNFSNWIFFTTENIVLEGKRGLIYYDPISNKQGQVFKYFIYGFGKQNKILEDSQTGLPFTLSNN